MCISFSMVMSSQKNLSTTFQDNESKRVLDIASTFPCKLVAAAVWSVSSLTTGLTKWSANSMLSQSCHCLLSQTAAQEANAGQHGIISSCVQCSKVDSTPVLGNSPGARAAQLAVCCLGLLFVNDNRRLLTVVAKRQNFECDFCCTNRQIWRS